MNPTFVGALLSGLGVIFGAFGAHALKAILPVDMLKVYETGTHYLLLHSFALIFYGLSKIKKMWPAWCFIAGIFFFTGSLYALAFTEIKIFGAITPIGGLLFIIGWLGFALSAKKERTL